MKKIKSFLIILIILFSSALKLKSNSVGVSFLEVVFIFVIINELFVNKFVYKGRFIKLLYGIIFIQFLSLFLLVNFEFSRILYAARFLEYFLIAYYIWSVFKNKLSINLLSIIFTLSSVVFLTNNLDNKEYLPFSYVWEASTFFSLYGVFFLDYFKNIKGKFLFFLCLVLVYFTNQRSPLVSMLIVYIYVEIIVKKKWVLFSTILFVFSFVGFGGFQFFENNRLFVFINSFSFENIKLAANTAYEYAIMSNSYDEFVYGDRLLLTDEGDLSLHLRFKKWAYALSDMNNVIRIIFGNGPGYFGGAADSSILRVFFETGILGIILWFSLLIKLVKKRYFPFIICVIINSLFIDTFYSSKITFLTVLIIMFYENRGRISSLQ
jgi:hypothetical protein